MPVPPFFGRLSGEDFDVDGVENEFQEFREEAGIGHFFFGFEPGPPQLVFKLSGRVALSFMAEIFKFEPETGAQFVEKKKFSGVGRDQDDFPSLLEDPGDLLERPVIGLEVFEVIEAESQVEGPILERKMVAGELDEIRAKQPLSFLEVGHVLVGAYPETSLLTDKIAQGALAAAEVEGDP